MKLSLLSRARIRIGRAASRLLFGIPFAYRPFRDSRRADLSRGLDPDTAVLLSAAALVGQSAPEIKSPAHERREMAISIGLADDRPVGDLEIRETRVPGASGPLDARLYTPQGLPAPSAGLMFILGGGWVTGDLDTHDTLCRRLALAGKMRVLSIAPRLAPEHPFPAAVDDSVAAFRYVARHAAEFGMDPARLGVGGDSAGGNLSAVVGQATRHDDRRPKLTLLLYPALDATCALPSHRTNAQGFFLTEASIRWYYKHYLGGEDRLRTDPRVSPLHAPALEGVADALVVVAGFDPLLDEGVQYEQRLAAAGVRVERMDCDSLVHGFALMTRHSKAALAATIEAAERTGAWLRD